MKRTFAFLLVMLLLGACAGQAIEVATSSSEPTTIFEPAPPFEVGSVTIVSNGVEHKPYEELEHMGERLPEGNISSSMRTTPLEELFDILPEVVYADDFEIVVDGNDAVWTTYSIYDDSFELIDYKLPLPDEPGLYILVTRTSWSYEYYGDSYLIYEYTVKVRK